MKIDINDHRKIFAIQRQFTEEFPFLKIEFFSKANKPGEGSSHKRIVGSSRTLGEAGLLHKKGEITVGNGMTVADLEQNFRDVYGLEIGIYRKSGTVWLETRETEKWTLEKQNLQGKTITQKMNEEEGK